MQKIPSKSTLEIFRDCLKVVPSMVQDRNKIVAVRKVVKAEFDRNKFEYDPEKIEQMRDNAIRGLSNYLLYHIKQQHLEEQKKKGWQQQNILKMDQEAEEEEEEQLQR